MFGDYRKRRENEPTTLYALIILRRTMERSKEGITARKIVETRCESVKAGVFTSKAQTCDATVS